MDTEQQQLEQAEFRRLLSSSIQESLQGLLPDIILQVAVVMKKAPCSDKGELLSSMTDKDGKPNIVSKRYTH